MAFHNFYIIFNKILEKNTHEKIQKFKIRYKLKYGHSVSKKSYMHFVLIFSRINKFNMLDFLINIIF